MIIFKRFLEPYIQFLLGAAYNVEQAIEGLKLGSSNFIVRDGEGNIIQSYWSPSEAAMFPLAMLLLYSLFLIGQIVLAGYICGKKKGSIITLLAISFPGVASALGYWPSINFIPDRFVVDGTGTLGSPWGMIPLLMMGFLTGWSVIIILYDLLDLRDKFRHYYDHCWYAMAILTGLFYVSDSNTNEIDRELKLKNQSARQGSAYLLQQLKAYDLQCRHTSSAKSASCVWASDTQQKLSELATFNEVLFPLFGPQASSEIYDPLRENKSSDQITKIRRELKAYNDLKCPVKVLDNVFSIHSRPSANCQSPPSSFSSSFPEPLEGISEKDIKNQTTVAVANESIIPSLISLRLQQEKLKKSITESNRIKHFRWLFFILFSFVVGGKVANATSRAIDIDKRTEHENHRVFGLIQFLLNFLIKQVRSGKELIFRIINTSFYILRKTALILILFYNNVFAYTKRFLTRN